jgi:hypothetical protein
MADIDITGTLVASSGLTSGILWRPHTGGQNQPIYNSAASLQQFIDALSPSRASLNVVTSHSSVVDPNPVRKMYPPR